MNELRRGKEKADIYCLNFDLKSQRLACSSDRSTIHIFTVNLQQGGIKLSEEEKEGVDGKEEEAVKPQNKKSKFSLLGSLPMGKLSQYFGSEWSYAKFKLPSGDNGQRQTCAFSADGQSLLVVSSDGFYYRANIGKNGACNIVEKQSLK